jgi:hypothetical protein
MRCSQQLGSKDRIARSTNCLSSKKQETKALHYCNRHCAPTRDLKAKVHAVRAAYEPNSKSSTKFERGSMWFLNQPMVDSAEDKTYLCRRCDSMRSAVFLANMVFASNLLTRLWSPLRDEVRETMYPLEERSESIIDEWFDIKVTTLALLMATMGLVGAIRKNVYLVAAAGLYYSILSLAYLFLFFAWWSTSTIFWSWIASTMLASTHFAYVWCSLAERRKH